MDPAQPHGGSTSIGTRDADGEIPIEVEILGDASARTHMGELHQRLERVERDARELVEAAEAILANAPPGSAHDAAHRNPLKESQLAAECRASGLYERAARHTMRAAELLEAAGCRREAREILEEGSVGLEYQPPEALEALAGVWQRLEVPARAAEIALSAAERLRAAARYDRVFEVCARVARLDPDTAGLHRTWGLALLASGNAASALGHLALWRQATGDLSARIWFTQALFDLEEEGASSALRDIARQVGLRKWRSLPIEGLGARVAAHLESHHHDGDPRPVQPFWEQPELCGSSDVQDKELDVEVSPARQQEPVPALGAAPRRPRVFISLDTEFHRVRLSEILGGEGIEVLRCSSVESIEDRLAREVQPIDLLLLSIPRGPRADLRFLRGLRRLPNLADTPILCVTAIDRSGLDFDELRNLGVAGLVDHNALPEEIVFRVNGVVWGRTGPIRRYPRAPVFFSVDLDAEGRVSSEHATTLACGGMGVVSSRPLELNSEPIVRFRLPNAPDELIEAHAKVVHCRPCQRQDQPGYRLGLFFYPLSDAHHTLVETEVRRILDDADF